MGGFEAEIGQLRASAKAAASAADQARSVKPGEGLEAVETALPGADAGTTALTLQTTLNGRASDWADEVDAWSRRVSASADSYAKSDDEATQAFK